MLNIFNLLTYEISEILENASNIIENKSTLLKQYLNISIYMEKMK